MVTSPVARSLGPLETIVNVGWLSKLLSIRVEGVVTAEHVGSIPPDPPLLHASVDITSATFQAIDPTEKDVRIFAPNKGSGPLIKRPFTGAILGGYSAFTFDVDEEIVPDVQTATDPIWIVTPDIVVILPETIPNPFASDSAAVAWILGFYSRHPGFSTTPFTVSAIAGGEDYSSVSATYRGTLFVPFGRIARATETTHVIFTVDCETNQTAKYTVKTYSKLETSVVDSLTVEVGHFIENDVKLYRNARVEFQVNKKTLEITSDAPEGSVVTTESD